MDEHEARERVRPLSSAVTPLEPEAEYPDGALASRKAPDELAHEATERTRERSEEIDVRDVRDAALKGIADWAEAEGLTVLTAMTQRRFGVVYVKGVTRFVVEVHDDIPS